ncbi:MAG: AraC family transcriptional regulator, partial [Clostridia bacterium]|nr:AraC family transcriptional regulator [Clostridia bacterium]
FNHSRISVENAKSIFDVQKFKNMLELFLIELYESKNYKSNCNEVLFNDIVLYLKLHINKKLPLEEIAQHFSVSVSKIQRLFAQQTGMSPKAFFKEIKLDYSKQLMYRQFNCKQIAIELAFNSEHHFSKSFKARYGIPPSQFLKSLKEKQKEYSEP